jgi:DNA-binding NarL/FixJ family response regulator
MSQLWQQLSPREHAIVSLLLDGYQNEDIAKELHIARRTVKAHFNRLFLRFHIQEGIKRVKLAVMFYRELQATEQSKSA